MPARAGQAPQHRLAGRLLVEMHRLRVEFGGKCHDLLARDMARPERAERARRKIFEGERHGLRKCRRDDRLWPHFTAITTRSPAWLVSPAARICYPGRGLCRQPDL